MNKIISFILLIFIFLNLSAQSQDKNIVIITARPQEAAIYVNNVFKGYGYAEFMKPKKKDQVAIIRIECEEYNTVLTKFYGADKRKSVSYALIQDGFYRASANSGVVNKFFTIDVDSMYYNRNENKLDCTMAWKMIHRILLNYFDEISETDYYGGYLQTPWRYKTFHLSEKKMRNRVTIRDISSPLRVAFQIKISSEIANSHAARTGEFTEVDRICKDLEPLIEELQTRIGKVHNM